MNLVILFIFFLIIEEQAQFNKFVREEVSKKFGEDFLLQHEVNQLESSIMELIKCKFSPSKIAFLKILYNSLLISILFQAEAISSFLPKDTSPSRAWTLAKVSLRSLKRDLRRKQNKMLPSKLLKSN